MARRPRRFRSSEAAPGPSSIVDLLDAIPGALERAQQGLESLEEAGVLLPINRKRRNQSWEADGLLSLLEGLEAGERPDSEPVS